MNPLQRPDAQAALPAAWFHNAIVDGLQLLITLALPGQPPAETVALTAHTWVTALWANRRWNAPEGDEPHDAERLRQAFVVLGGRIERWPAPHALLEALPPPEAVPLLREPRPTLKQIEANLARLAAVRDQLVRQMAEPRAQDPASRRLA